MMPIYSKRQVERMGDVPMPKVFPYLFVVSLILISSLG